MPKNAENKETLKSLIAQIQELLNELKNEQNNISKNLNRHHNVTMQKLQKLKDFNEIADMTNQVFERRISNIEKILKEKTKTH